MDHERTIVDSFRDHRVDRLTMLFERIHHVFLLVYVDVDNVMTDFQVQNKAKRASDREREKRFELLLLLLLISFYLSRGRWRWIRLMMLNNRVKCRWIRLRNDNRLIFEINKRRKRCHCPC